MKGKNKKLLWFEAGILIMTLITFSVGGSANVANLLKNRPAQPTDIPWINLGGPYQVKGTNIFVLEFYILYGTPPYTVTINWGDGSPSKNYTTDDGYVIAIHKYETCRNEPYRLQVWVTDSVGGYARAETDVFVLCCECDLSVSLRDLPGNDGPFHCENEEIMFRVTLKSTDNTDFCICDKFLLSLTIHSSCGAPFNKTYGPISPGQPLTIDIPCCQACGPGKHTATVTIIPIDIIDNYPGNNVASHNFYIFSEETCYILNKIFGLFHKSSGSVFLDDLQG